MTDPIEELKNYFISEANKLDTSFSASNPTGHPSDTGENRQDLLIHFLNNHLPSKYEALPGGKVFDVDGKITGQVDVVVYDKNTPRLGTLSRQLFLAEGVGAAIEVKPELNLTSLKDCMQKAKSYKLINKKINASLVMGKLSTKIYSGAFAYKLGTDMIKIFEEVNNFYKDIDLENSIDFICVNKKFIILKNEGGWVNEKLDGSTEEIKDKFLLQEGFESSLYRMLMMMSAKVAVNYVGYPDYSRYINIR